MDFPENVIPTLRVRAPREGRVEAGWLLGQIDVAGSLEAERLSGGPVATVAVNAFQFAAPINAGDVVGIYVEKLRIGQKSVTLKVAVFAHRVEGAPVQITDVTITYVAVDGQGKSRYLSSNKE